MVFLYQLTSLVVVATQAHMCNCWTVTVSNIYYRLAVRQALI